MVELWEWDWGVGTANVGVGKEGGAADTIDVAGPIVTGSNVNNDGDTDDKGPASGSITPPPVPPVG